MKIIEYRPKPDPELIAICEDLLDDARNGNIRAIAFAIAFHDGCTANGWGQINKHTMRIISEIEVLKQEIINHYVDMRDKV